MSNKTQLQTNNTEYAFLIETLRGKAIPSGEDVTDETNVYTAKIASLESAVTALETELAGKASGGSGGGIETCTIELREDDSLSDSEGCIYYIDGNSNYKSVNFKHNTSITVQKYSIIGIEAVDANVSNTISIISGSYIMKIAFVSGDGFISSMSYEDGGV